MSRTVPRTPEERRKLIDHQINRPRNRRNAGNEFGYGSTDRRHDDVQDDAGEQGDEEAYSPLLNLVDHRQFSRRTNLRQYIANGSAQCDIIPPALLVAHVGNVGLTETDGTWGSFLREGIRVVLGCARKDVSFTRTYDIVKEKQQHPGMLVPCPWLPWDTTQPSQSFPILWREIDDDADSYSPLKYLSSSDIVVISVSRRDTHQDSDLDTDDFRQWYEEAIMNNWGQLLGIIVVLPLPDSLQEPLVEMRKKIDDEISEVNKSNSDLQPIICVAVHSRETECIQNARQAIYYIAKEAKVKLTELAKNEGHLNTYTRRLPQQANCDALDVKAASYWNTGKSGLETEECAVPPVIPRDEVQTLMRIGAWTSDVGADTSFDPMEFLKAFLTALLLFSFWCLLPTLLHRWQVPSATELAPRYKLSRSFWGPPKQGLKHDPVFNRQALYDNILPFGGMQLRTLVYSVLVIFYICFLGAAYAIGLLHRDQYGSAYGNEVLILLTAHALIHALWVSIRVDRSYLNHFRKSESVLIYYGDKNIEQTLKALGEICSGQSTGINEELTMRRRDVLTSEILGLVRRTSTILWTKFYTHFAAVVAFSVHIGSYYGIASANTSLDVYIVLTAAMFGLLTSILVSTAGTTLDVYTRAMKAVSDVIADSKIGTNKKFNNTIPGPLLFPGSDEQWGNFRWKIPLYTPANVSTWFEMRQEILVQCQYDVAESSGVLFATFIAVIGFLLYLIYAWVSELDFAKRAPIMIDGIFITCLLLLLLYKATTTLESHHNRHCYLLMEWKMDAGRKCRAARSSGSNHTYVMLNEAREAIEECMECLQRNKPVAVAWIPFTSYTLSTTMLYSVFSVLLTGIANVGASVYEKITR
eukprot:gb/GECG01000901.1/.p1 GENE.gb/GECG01000901.1/~~gb/GECG01000901.1/.p1  ORF type:complete len:868 (+),score=73.05 gb/GECG01000901.1/:1-2604(+)